MVSSVHVVFANQDMFLSIAEQADLPTIARLARVCKLWNQWLNSPQLWKKLSEKEGIPLVECAKGQERNLRSDFRILYPITISGKMISEFFGKMVGTVPPIQEAIFNRLNQADPFEPAKLIKKNYVFGKMISEFFGKMVGTVPHIQKAIFNRLNQADLFEKGKLIKDNYVFVVMPDKIQRTVDEKTPLDLDVNENLIKLPPGTAIVKHDLVIPFSLKNLRMLCAYPLKGKENTPVFDKNFSDAVFNHCNSHPDKVTVYFMRKRVADQSRNQSYAAQQEIVKSEEFEVTPLRERALLDSVMILKSGTCPDNRNPPIFARTRDAVLYGSDVYQSVVGGFAPRVGVCVSYDDYVAHDYFGVVPGVPAEVLRP